MGWGGDEGNRYKVPIMSNSLTTSIILGPARLGRSICFQPFFEFGSRHVYDFAELSEVVLEVRSGVWMRERERNAERADLMTVSLSLTILNRV